MPAMRRGYFRLASFCFLSPSLSLPLTPLYFIITQAGALLFTFFFALISSARYCIID